MDSQIPQTEKSLVQSEGYTSLYYLIPKDASELQDLIAYKNMNSQLGEIFRSCYRYGEVAHSDQLRDAKKIRFYAGAEIARLTKKSIKEMREAELKPLLPIDKKDKDHEVDISTKILDVMRELSGVPLFLSQLKFLVGLLHDRVPAHDLLEAIDFLMRKGYIGKVRNPALTRAQWVYPPREGATPG